MNCRETNELLGRLLFDDWDGAAGERDGLLRHVSACEECGRRLEDMRAASDLLREGLAAGPDPVLSPDRVSTLLAAAETGDGAGFQEARGGRVILWPWHHRQLLGVAAAAAVLAMVLFPFALRHSTDRDGTDVARAADEQAAEDDLRPTVPEPAEPVVAELVRPRAESEAVRAEAAPRVAIEAQSPAADAPAFVARVRPSEPRSHRTAPAREKEAPSGTSPVTAGAPPAVRREPPPSRRLAAQNRPRVVLETLAAEQRKARTRRASASVKKRAAPPAVGPADPLTQRLLAQDAVGDRAAAGPKAEPRKQVESLEEAEADGEATGVREEPPQTVALAARAVVGRRSETAAPKPESPADVVSVAESSGYEAVKRTILLGRLPAAGAVDPRAFTDAFAGTGDEDPPAEAKAMKAGGGERRVTRAVAKAEGEPGAAAQGDMSAVPPLPEAGESPVPYLRACAAEFAAILRDRDPTAVRRLAKMGADLRRVEAVRPTDERVKELRDLVERASQLLKARPPR